MTTNTDFTAMLAALAATLPAQPASDGLGELLVSLAVPDAVQAVEPLEDLEPALEIVAEEAELVELDLAEDLIAPDLEFVAELNEPEEAEPEDLGEYVRSVQIASQHTTMRPALSAAFKARLAECDAEYQRTRAELLATPPRLPDVVPDLEPEDERPAVILSDSELLREHSRAVQFREVLALRYAELRSAA